MAKVNRLSYNNLITAATSILVPSSEVTSLPRAALLRPKISDRWRTKLGWTVVLNENDKIDFDRGGVKQATVAAGTYATGALLAAAIVAALEAADAVPVWACSYSAVTSKFTISSDLAFVLLFETGTNLPASIHLDLGFADADTASAITHTGANVAYQSRHALHVDLGSAQAFAGAIVRGHNISAGAEVRLNAHTASMIGTGFTVPFASPPDVNVLLLGTDPRIVFFASESKRYLRLVIEDVQNPVGYAEVGVFFVGPYAQPTILESVNFIKRYEHLSEVIVASGGSHEHVRRARRLVYTLMWEEIQQANIDIFDALDLAMPMGACFFLSLDAADNPTATVYGSLRRGFEAQKVSGPYSNVPLEFAEALP